MNIDDINQIFGVQYRSFDEITYHEALRMLVALRCVELGAQVFICGGRPTLRAPDPPSALEGDGESKESAGG